MKSFLCVGVVLGLIAVATALKCNSCSFRLGSLCFGSSSPIDCTGNCTYTTATMGSTSLFTTQGCAKNCEIKNQTDSPFSFEYKTQCCSTDLCNGGNSIKISLSLGLGMALMWLLNAL